MKRLELSLLIGLIFSLLLGSSTVYANQCDNIRSNVLRLHIIANSDSEQDQQLKLAVRDAVLEQTSELFTTAYSRNDAEKAVADNLDKLNSIAQCIIKSRGFDYKTEVMLVNMFFETRQYGNIIMPAGRYDAVRIIIGEGKGKNWWCVMFPPLCVPAAAEKKEQQAPDLKPVDAQVKYTPKLAVVELYEKIKNQAQKQNDDIKTPD